RHLVAEHGVRHLLLASRRGAAAPGSAELAAELTGLGTQVELAACDTTDRAAVQALLAGIDASRPLTGLVHAAGLLDDGVFDSLTEQRLATVFGPKVSAAWHLHELTAGHELALFTLFSSATATIGAAGQANYAAANAFLDGLAQYRRGQGLAGSSLAWGRWEQASAMTGTLGSTERDRVIRSAPTALSTELALALFDASLDRADSLLVPARIPSEQLRGSAVSPVLRGLVRGRPARRTSAEPAPEQLRERLIALSGIERARAVAKLVREQAALVLGHSGAEAIVSRQPFSEQGFDSLTSVELRNRLGTATGLRLPAAAIFDHPTPDALARYLTEKLLPIQAETVPAPVTEPAPDSAAGDALDIDSLDAESLVLRALQDGGDGPENDGADNDWAEDDWQEADR
ncbi:MAG: beta-ketoacyl reductase, partial [Actinomycetota bacterium]|nr:beta-ketoacyl reductase [Actinomycetota bacterium]